MSAKLSGNQHQIAVAGVIYGFDPANTANINAAYVNANGQILTIGSSGGAAASNPSSIISGQQATTTSAVALPSQALTNGIVITALANNVGTIYVGPAGVSNTTGYPLAPGASISYGVTNLSAISIIGINTTDKVAYTGN